MKIICIIKDYISQNKTVFFTYLLICCLFYLVKVFIMSFIYEKLFSKNSDIPKVIRNICFVWVFICVIYLIKIRLETKLFSEFLCYIRSKIFEFYLKVNEYNFNDSCISTDVSKLLDLTRNIRDLLYWFCQTLFPIFILIFCINVYFLIKFPKIGLLNIVGNILLGYVCLIKAPKSIESSIEKEDQYIKIIDKIDENFNNMMNIYLNNKVQDTLNDNQVLDNQYKEIYIRQSKDFESFIMYLKGITYSFSLATLIFLYKTSTIDEFIKGLLIYTFYISTFENMSEDIPYYMLIYGSIKNTELFFSKKELYPLPLYTQNLKNFTGKIDFVNVSFQYQQYPENKGDNDEDNQVEEKKNILDNFSLSVKKGERLTIFARSGSGKSTMMKLLLAFYKPQNGSILLDGQNINDISPSEIREKINYINQRTLLFQDTILGNMKYGNNKTDQEIIDVLKKYNLLSVFSKTSDPNSLQTQVIRNGTNISMGMQKVIFIVRGLLKEGVVVNILDEPLTSIDPSTRQNILNFINDYARDNTLIIISHDKEVQSIPNMKMIFIGKEGKDKKDKKEEYNEE